MTLDDFTEDELMNARHVLLAIYEGVDANLSYEEAEALQTKGLLCDLVKLPGRGRYAGRFEFYWNDELKDIVDQYEQRITETARSEV